VCGCQRVHMHVVFVLNVCPFECACVNACHTANAPCEFISVCAYVFVRMHVHASVCIFLCLYKCVQPKIPVIQLVFACMSIWVICLCVHMSMCLCMCGCMCACMCGCFVCMLVQLMFECFHSCICEIVQIQACKYECKWHNVVKVLEYVNKFSIQQYVNTFSIQQYY